MDSNDILSLLKSQLFTHESNTVRHSAHSNREHSRLYRHFEWRHWDYYFRFRDETDEELLQMIEDLAPLETRPKTEARILRLSEFESRVPRQTVVTWWLVWVRLPV